jgi:hypothetical protein
MIHQEYQGVVHPNNAISKYIVLPRNHGNEYRIAVPPLTRAEMLPQPSFEMPPLFKLVYYLVARQRDGDYLYKFAGAEA